MIGGHAGNAVIPYLKEKEQLKGNLLEELLANEQRVCNSKSHRSAMDDPKLTRVL